jgi:putative membrane protein
VTLALLNAVLNLASGVLAALGFVAIRQGNRERHKALMQSAFVVSALFLVSYSIRVVLTGTHRFPGSGWLRGTYLAILGSHTTLAMLAVPLVLVTLYLARKSRIALHKKIARVTLPVWLYVSVTGVVVYVMLYHVARV